MKNENKILLAEIILVVIICSYNSDFILAFLWILAHEVAHIIVASKLGCKYYNIELHLFGARAEVLELEMLSDKKKILVYLAGPLFNIISVVILALLNYIITSPIVDLSIGLNLGLAFFNLLPAYPLDGSRIYELLLSRKILFKKAEKIISIISYCTGSGLIALSIVSSIFLHKYNISFLVGGIIIIIITKKQRKDTMYITMGNIVGKRTKLITNNYIENKSISVYYKIGLVKVLGLVDRNKFNSFYVLDDEMKLLMVFYEDELINALKDYGNISLQEYIEVRKGKE